jgi:hypothetical protein
MQAKLGMRNPFDLTSGSLLSAGDALRCRL